MSPKAIRDPDRCVSHSSLQQSAPQLRLKTSTILFAQNMAIWAGLGGDRSSLLRWCQLGQLAWGWKIPFQDGPTPMAGKSGLALGSFSWSSGLGRWFPSSSPLPMADLGFSRLSISRDLGFLHGGCFPRAHTQKHAGLLLHLFLFLI